MPFGFNAGGSISNTNGSFTGTDQYNKNTTQDTKFNQSSTPTNPAWVDQGGADIYGAAAHLAGQDPSQYFLGPNGLEGQAYGASAGLTGSPWNFDGAADVTRGIAAGTAPQVGTAATASPYVQNYMNPYLDQVVGATSADLDANDAQTRARQALAQAKSGALGGSGAAITQSLTEGQLERARATTLGGLRSQGYTQALTAANADANRSESAKELNANLRGQSQDRSLAAAKQLGDLSTSYDANQRANIGTQLGTGEMLRGIQQAQAQGPLQLSQYLQSIFSGLPLNLYHGEDQAGTQNQVGTDIGTENQSGTSKSTTVGGKFGFSFGGG